MKNFMANMRENRKSKFDLAIIAMFFTAVVLGCGGGSSKPDPAKKPIPAAYLGSWTGQDGTTLAIRGDGSGDYNAGNSKVNGASVEVDEAGKTIKFTMLGVSVGKYTIDSPPADDQMKLDGTTFRRSGGVDTSSTKTDNSLPSEDELQSLVKQTMMDFGQAVETGDFTMFYNKAAKATQEHTTPQELKTAFKSFIDKKLDTRIVKDMKANFSPAPEIDDNGTLNVVGGYPTTPPTNFELKYLRENGEWKLTFIKLKVK